MSFTTDAIIGASPSILTITESSGVHMISSEKKTGISRYTFSGNNNTVDLLAGSTPATLIANANVDLVAGVMTKNIAGNSWNASGYSQEGFNVDDGDWGVSWEIEAGGTVGTVREMAGISENPSQNNSYTNLFGPYQVNGYWYSRIYENGVAKIIPGYATKYFQEGDRPCVFTIDKKPVYGIIRGTDVIEIYRSEEVLEGTYYFKAAFNRGVGSSGHSVLGGVAFHTDQKIDTFSVTIQGEGSDLLSEEDKVNLENHCGMIIGSGATYADLSYQRALTAEFDNGGTPYDLNVSYAFLGDLQFLNEIITF